MIVKYLYLLLSISTMDLPWGDERTKKFVTNVGVITSNGHYQNDIMACEWTHHVSYSPGLIAVCIRANDATHANISSKEEFGVNICSSDQNILSSIAGNYSGKDTDKIGALKELGFKFFKAKKINVLMVQGAAMNAECRLFKKIELGDHTTFVGEIVELYPLNNKAPLVYHAQKYWKFGTQIKKPSKKEMEKIKEIIVRWKHKG